MQLWAPHNCTSYSRAYYTKTSHNVCFMYWAKIIYMYLGTLNIRPSTLSVGWETTLALVSTALRLHITILAMSSETVLRLKKINREPKMCTSLLLQSWASGGARGIPLQEFGHICLLNSHIFFVFKNYWTNGTVKITFFQIINILKLLAVSLLFSGPSLICPSRNSCGCPWATILVDKYLM